MAIEPSPNPGVSIRRREVLMRGGVLGSSALVWSTPLVQTMSRATAGSMGSSPPPGGFGAIASVAVVVHDDSTYQFRIAADGSVQADTPMRALPCPKPPGWNEPGTIAGYPDGTTWEIADPRCWAIIVPRGAELVGVAMGAGGTASPGNYYVAPTVSDGRRRYTFCAPPA